MYENKILDLELLADRLEEKRQIGKKIVHCHGCFDLLHPGHIKHFEAAKKFGDILVVSITPDRFVNKGPGRPIYNERLRAETIASLVFVDYVCINKWLDAIETIKMLKPDFYVKGQDYKDRDKDVTKKIYEEEKAVEGIGGEIRFTDEVTFSSSGLINRFFSVLSNEATGYLREFRNDHNIEEINTIIENLSELEVFVIGDVIIDDYTFCESIGKSTKAPIVSCRKLTKERYPGGVLAVANHISNFVRKVHLITTLGFEPEIHDFVISHLNKNIEPHIFKRKVTPTIVKERYIEKFNNQKILEVSDLFDNPISHDIEKRIIGIVQDISHKCDIAIIADFGHGLITPAIINDIQKLEIFISTMAQTNSANYGFNMITKYKNIDYICIDERELRLPLSDKFGDVEKLILNLSKKLDCDKINITLGKSGSLYYSHKEFYFVPIFSSDIIDSVGAGDAVFSITSLLAANNAPPELIPFVGNCVGAMAIRILGNKESIEKATLIKFMGGMLK